MATNEEPQPVEPSAYVTRQNQDAVKNLPDAGLAYENAGRYQIAPPDEPFVPSRISKSDSKVWDFTAFDFLEQSLDEVPGSVAPALWRQGQLNSTAGLFQVTDRGNCRVHQIRGYDLANMTVVESGSGLVVIDPLGSYETARAALARYRSVIEQDGPAQPVRAVIHTQSGVDHFGGVRGLFGDALPKDLKVYAPEGFLADALLRQVTEGSHTARLVDYAYGTRLGIAPSQLVDSDLGHTVSVGDATFLAPTDTVGGLLPAATAESKWPSWTGIGWREGLYALEIGGVRIVLQPAGGHASPAEMNLYLPAARTVYLAGPGLLGGPSKARATFLDATLTAFGAAADAGAGAYLAPVWRTPEDAGQEQGTANRITAWLTAHRDAATTAPDAGAAAPLLATPGYADTPTRTVREVWSRLTGTDLGAPRLAVTAKASLLAQGGSAKALEAARGAYGAGNHAEVAALLDPVICAAAIPLAVNSKNEQQARTLQADALRQLAHLTSHGRLRNALLTAAQDVRDPKGVLTRFPRTIADLAAAASPLGF
ncbi:alkyl sulfatase dimerization domain-containing protein [Streptomyces typhae]|nr:alkyl sulfatase dimerization domain-containing protein [Streptomyces typhae]